MNQFTKPRKAFALRRTAFSLSLGLGLLACGRSHPSFVHTERDGTPADAEQNYSVWCQEWLLTCKAPIKNIPDGGEKIATESLGILNSIALDLLASPSQLTLTRADLDAPNLVRGLSQLQLDGARLSLRERLDSIGWTRATLAAQRLELSASQGGTLTSASGLSWGFDSASAIQFGPERLSFEGVSLKSANTSQQAPLASIAFTRPEALSLSLGDRRVTEVDSLFLGETLSEALGGTLDKNAKPATRTRTQTIASLHPLLSWLNEGQRTLSLQRSFFANTAEKLARAKDVDPAILGIFRALESLETAQQASGKNAATLTQMAGAKLSCNMNKGELILNFDRSFGIKRFYLAEGGGIGFEFYGVKASSRQTIGSFSLKRIELTPDSYVIRDVPLLGKIAISWDQLEKEAADKGKKVETVCSL